MQVNALILSGGAGTRLWPLSSPERPKQFLKLFGERSLFQMTIERLSASAVDHVVIVAQRDHEPLIREQLGEIDWRDFTLLLEPMRRDSGPAIAAGVAHVLATDGPDAIVLALPCDHLIPSIDAFATAVRSGMRLARAGYLGTFGVRPTMASTEFGYVQRGAAIGEVPGSFRVQHFHEKPTADRAKAYLVDGGYDWNSGMFVFSAGRFADEAVRHMPDVWSAVGEAVHRATGNGDLRHLEASAFERAPRISIDYALFEKSARVGVVPVSFAWSDIGTWRAVRAAQACDARGNAVVGNASLREAVDNLIVTDGTKVAVIGVTGLAVVATARGVLVAPLDRAAEIKAMLGE
jgi:mannose-1-phosphate guanylyltransferase/mannose-6-phosphate isomerase